MYRFRFIFWSLLTIFDLLSSYFIGICVCHKVIDYYFCRLHAWGDNMSEAFAQCAMAMYGYMTEIESVEELTDLTIEASGINTVYQIRLEEYLQWNFIGHGNVRSSFALISNTNQSACITLDWMLISQSDFDWVLNNGNLQYRKR